MATCSKVRFVSSLRLSNFLALLALTGLCSQAAASGPSNYEKLLSLTAERSPDLQIIRAAATQKTAQLYTSWVRWLPAATLSLAQTTSRDNSFLFSGLSLGGAPITVNEVTIAKWTLGITVPIYSRSIHLSLEQSAAESDLAGLQLKNAMGELDWRLRQVLGSYLLQLYRQTSLDHSAEIAKTNVKDAQLRFDLGQNTKVDVLRAEANLASIEARRITQAQDAQTARMQVVQFTGADEATLSTLEFEPSSAQAAERDAQIARQIAEFTQSDTVIAALSPWLTADPGTLEQRLEATIPESSTTYRAKYTEEAISSTQAAVAMASEWPSFALNASLYNQRAAGNWSQVFTTDQLSYQFAFTLQIPIFSFGSSVSTFIQKFQAQKGARLKREKEILQLKNDIYADLLRVKALTKTLESSQLVVSQNEQIARLSQTSYRLGKSTLVELLQSDSDLTTAKLTAAQSRIDLAVTARKLAWNLGVSEP